MSMNNQTYYSQEKAREVVESVTNFVNTSGRSTAELFAETLMREHRTLQQGSFYVMSKCIEKWAEQYENGNYDLRNESTAKVCHQIWNDILKDTALPYV